MMKKTLLSLILATVTLAACDFGSAPEGKAYDELPPLTRESTRAFYKALPAAAVPEGIKTLAERERHFAAYDAWTEEVEREYDHDADYDPDDPENFYVVSWSPAMLDSEGMYEAEHGGVIPYATLTIYPGADPDRLFGILESGYYTTEDSHTEPPRYFWYSIASNKCRSLSALPMDKPYTEEDLTADPLLTYGADGLYYAIKEKDFEPLFMQKTMQVYINNVGTTDVVYNWNGVQFVRDETYKAPIIYNYGFGNVSLGGNVPWNINGYSTNYIDNTGDGPRYDIVKEGESTPTFSVQANPSDDMRIWAIHVYSDRYVNHHSICPGMKANEVCRILEEANQKWYGGECPLSVSPTYYDIDEKEYAAIFSGFQDNFIYLVDKDKYLGDNRFTSDARVLAIAIINAVG